MKTDTLRLKFIFFCEIEGTLIYFIHIISEFFDNRIISIMHNQCNNSNN